MDEDAGTMSPSDMPMRHTSQTMTALCQTQCINPIHTIAQVHNPGVHTHQQTNKEIIRKHLEAEKEDTEKAKKPIPCLFQEGGQVSRLQHQVFSSSSRGLAPPGHAAAKAEGLPHQVLGQLGQG